uniref:Uncharacterized protein n=1 Tax=Varanus komodoensis TaxID=61221 RepID=A0A8D2L765_VARKO
MAQWAGLGIRNPPPLFGSAIINGAELCCQRCPPPLAPWQGCLFLYSLVLVVFKKKNQTIVLLLFLHRAEEYGPIVRLNAFHKVALLVLSPEGTKVRYETFSL